MVTERVSQETILTDWFPDMVVRYIDSGKEKTRIAWYR